MGIAICDLASCPQLLNQLVSRRLFYDVMEKVALLPFDGINLILQLMVFGFLQEWLLNNVDI